MGQFSTHDDVYFVRGKLSELHFYAKLSPNRGETVLECMNISWTQDLRVQPIHSFKEHTLKCKTFFGVNSGGKNKIL